MGASIDQQTVDMQRRIDALRLENRRLRTMVADLALALEIRREALAAGGTVSQDSNRRPNRRA